LPGLINAHNHLQLNGFPVPAYDRHYRNAGEWIADLNNRLGNGSAFRSARAIARDERLLHGGLKNLLSGVTTVAHHDPLYPILATEDYPVQVVATYGWSHSLEIDGDDSVRDAYRRTPIEWPWIIHAAEGIDDESAAEFDRLDELGCLGPNTLLIHGVALDSARRARLEGAAAGLIWCPTSNLRLFGRTAEVADLIDSGRVALGSDSRLTGARDLLEEVRVAGEVGGFDDVILESLVTDAGARLLRLPDRGVLRIGARADILVLPARMPLSKAGRKDLRLVMSGGSMRCGDEDFAEVLMSKSERAEIRVDGHTKIVSQRLHALLGPMGSLEAGLELSDAAEWAA
jgi:cytosine/adenosine deaminase-related metal-dependent hydrolase